MGSFLLRFLRNEDGFLGNVISSVAGLVGASKDRSAAKQAATVDYQREKEFAQNSLSWRVSDAIASGLHPLVGAGINPAQYSGSPQMVGSSFADSYANAGHSIGRAVDSMRTSSQRSTAKKAESLMLEKAALENQLLRSQITHVQRASNPPLPGDTYAIDGQSSSGLVRNSPMHRSATVRGWSDPDSIGDVGWIRTPSGGVAKVFGADTKQRVEDSLLPEFEWFFRNRLNPFTSGKANPNGVVPPPKGAIGWRCSSARQEYVPVRPSLSLIHI